MEALPDAIVQYILSNINDGRDVVTCSSVSNNWKDLMSLIKNLYFSRNMFDNLSGECTSDSIILDVVSSIVRLENLTVYCPFTTPGLTSWLQHLGTSLRVLDLRLDDIHGGQPSNGMSSKLDCLRGLCNLESLRLWGVLMVNSPKWDVFYSLKNLEIVGGKMEDPALANALLACPNLVSLTLINCEGLKYVAIELPYLKNCKLDFYGSGNTSLSLSSPCLEFLEIQGCSWIRVLHTQHLKSLCIANNSGKVYMVDLGKQEQLETLSMRGVQWSWDAIRKLLEMASEVKHLFMKVEFTGDSNVLQAFPEIDLDDFFNSHPKLQSFDMHGAMFAAFCHNNNLKNVEPNFEIPCLEEAVITIRSPLNAEQKINTLECLAKYASKLRKLSIRVLQMKSIHSSDDFFEGIWRFKSINSRIVSIE